MTASPGWFSRLMKHFLSRILFALACLSNAGMAAGAVSLDGAKACSIARLEGHGTLVGKGESNSRSLKKGMAFGAGDELRMESDSQAVVLLGDTVAVWLGPETRTKWSRAFFSKEKGARYRIELVEGRLAFHGVRHPGERSLFETEALGVVVKVQEGSLEISMEDGGFRTHVFAGSALVQSPQRAEKVESGYSALFQDGFLRMKRRLDRSELGRFERWKRWIEDALGKSRLRDPEERDDAREKNHRQKKH